MSRPKETFFFSDEFDRGVEWFRRHFEAHDGETAIGEASPTTMYAPDAASRVRQVLGAPKLIFCIRDPVERAYSDYFFRMTQGKIPPDITFEEVVREKKAPKSKLVIERGKYEKYVEKFDNEFGQKNMKFVFQKYLKGKTKSEMGDVLNFLGVGAVQELEQETAKTYNKTKYPNRKLYHWVRQCWHMVRGPIEGMLPKATETIRQSMRKVLFSEEKPPMDNTVREYLRDLYAEHNARLAEYLGRDLSHWE
jgi:hypothetical protein